MIETASRQIMWNVSAPANTVVMYAMLVVALIIATNGLVRRVQLWSTGRTDPDRKAFGVSNLLLRCNDLLENALCQAKVIREWLPAIAHSLVYLGFLVLLFTTTMVFIEHDLGIKIYRGWFYLFVTLLSDIFGAGLLIGCAIFAHRRYLAHADLVHNRLADSFLLIVLALLVVQGFLLEGLRIHATDDPWRYFSPVGLLVAKLFWSFSVPAAETLHFIIWWFHTITVMAVIAVVPYTKFFHVLASSLNLFFERALRPLGCAPSPGNIKQLMENSVESFGLTSIKDYTWKNLLDLDACTSCGRCQDVCPAYASGKPLSPKFMILDTRNHMLALHAKEQLARPSLLANLDGALTMDLFLPSSGLEPNGDGLQYANGGTFRAQNPAVQGSARMLGASADQRIAGDVMDPAVFWSCTTCMACVEACPVGINHVDQIIGNRQSMTLMHGEVPHEAQATLRALENRSNPFGAPEDRIKWAAGLDLPIVKAGDSVDYLYWVGCVSAFDPRKQKIARSLVKLMRAAGLSFGVLGNAEGCSGDPARRLGEENLFQTLANNNIETLKSVRFKVLVANCPHCFNTIKNEYPQFGNLGEGQQPEIIHHSVLLKRLLAEGKLTLSDAESEITFHDPCYLGRGNGEYDAPRDSLRSIKGLKIIEMEQTREKAMCCGAGGGHFWMDLKQGSRINVLRTEQAAATGTNEIATGCPFCLQMMEDGVKLTNREDTMGVRDIAEILAERVIVAQ